MIIKVERSGGLAAIPFYKEVDTSKLPSNLQVRLKKMVESPKPLRSTKATPKGARDHYVYKISIQDGSSQRIIECTQYDINEDIKALVRYVEKRLNE
jgi:hypothetical protein